MEKTKKREKPENGKSQSGAAAPLTGDYEADVRLLDETLRIGKSFDVIGRNITIGGRRARLYGIDGFVKDDLMQRVMQFLMGVKPEELERLPSMEAFADRFLPYVEVAVADEAQDVGVQVLCWRKGMRGR